MATVYQVWHTGRVVGIVIGADYNEACREANRLFHMGISLGERTFISPRI